MPTSVSLNTYDPVTAQRNVKKQIFKQLEQDSPMLASMLDKSAERKADGMQTSLITVDEFEVIQRDIEIAQITTNARIAPSASISTSVSKTVPTLVRTLYGGLTCDYATAPMSLNEWIHAGPGARHPIKKIYIDSIANKMTQYMIDGMLSAGSGNDPDGLLKWTSESATKWGLDTSATANAYFRGHAETVATADFDEDLVSDWIKLARSGQQTISGTVTYSNLSKPKLGICDSTTFQTMKKWVRERQTIDLGSLRATEERYKIGGTYRMGIMIDEVVFLPDLALDRLRDTNSSVGEIFIIDPEAFELIFFKGFAFDFITDPDKALGNDAVKGIIEREFADVVWGKYVINIALWNMFCSHPRNQLYGQITAT